MTQRVTRRRWLGARSVAVGSAMVLTAALAVVAGTAGAAVAIPAAGTTRAVEDCADRASAAVAARAAADTTPPARAVVGAPKEKISYGLPDQAPVGLWTQGGITLRAPVTKGTVRLDVDSRGFSTDSLSVQRYVPEKHRWVDLDTRPSGSDAPQHGVFTFPLTASASADHPYTVALRFQDLDRPGSFTVTASVDDGKGHTFRTPARTATATRPDVSVTGWQRQTTLTRGGPASEATVTVKNTTDRPYPALRAAYFAYGQGTAHALAPKDLILQQYRPGHGWERVALVAGGCDPGMSAALHAADAKPLAPGATAVYRIRVAVAPDAPRDVTTAQAGISVGNGDLAFFSRDLPFAIKDKK
ncbi:hypothetical protein CTZ27_32445 [Streptomyces griseocarneus]|nr:hypothetical protein CTZ27_32445 [Streptomyces griseocarneus]